MGRQDFDLVAANTGFFAEMLKSVATKSQSRIQLRTRKLRPNLLRQRLDRGGVDPSETRQGHSRTLYKSSAVRPERDEDKETKTLGTPGIPDPKESYIINTRSKRPLKDFRKVL